MQTAITIPFICRDINGGLQRCCRIFRRRCKGRRDWTLQRSNGFDNLHDPEGILKDAEEKAAALYGADSCYYSVNGSTAGLLTAISAAVPEGGKLILARNCHKAVYHSIYLRRLTPVYLYPDIVPGTSLAGTLTKEQIEVCADSESGRICSAFDLSDL